MADFFIHQHVAPFFHRNLRSLIGHFNRKNLPPPLFKHYERFPEIRLPEARALGQEVGPLFADRASHREYEGSMTPSLEEVSTVLQFGFGLRNRERFSQNRPGHPFTAPRTYYPSGGGKTAGGRYPLECYFLSREDGDLAGGLYHYHPPTHTLNRILSRGEVEERFPALVMYDFAREAPSMIIVTAVWHRNFAKYKDFGYPVVLLEAGHAAQNVLLSATALGLASCPLMGFNFDGVCELLDIDGVTEAPIYSIILGALPKKGERVDPEAVAQEHE